MSLLAGLLGTCISVKYRYDKVLKYMGSDTLNLVTPARLGEECLEDVDLESVFKTSSQDEAERQ